MKTYGGNVFAFNHPTLSVSPWLNAWSLQSALAKSKANFDVIAHSRGGLVARWWCEAFDAEARRCRKAILVGSPLAGTSLASPPRIRETLSLLTSYGNAVAALAGVGSTIIPLAGFVSTLLHVMTAFTAGVSQTPAFDIGLALVPGLFGQSRVGNNQELLELHRSETPSDRYSFVTANFQSDAPGWRFWKYFQPKFLVDAATDKVFDGPNDLVVDTQSMTHIADRWKPKKSHLLEFGTTDEVHHINYFEKTMTIDFLREQLKLR